MRGVRTNFIEQELRDHGIAVRKIAEQNLTSQAKIEVTKSLITHERLLEILIWKCRDREKRNSRDRRSRARKRANKADNESSKLLAVLERDVVNQHHKEQYGQRNKAPRPPIKKRLIETVPSTGILISLFSFIEWFPVPQLLYNLL